jgi:hypothetical protein
MEEIPPSDSFWVLPSIIMLYKRSSSFFFKRQTIPRSFRIRSVDEDECSHLQEGVPRHRLGRGWK